ncbi:unnamed protein product [Penicillium nalgiovense]|nr:unnamed protein product [Penicillium nalgiovense]
MPYRFEIAAQGRAGCKATDCLKDKVKITKGEFRVGTWVDGPGFQSWSWRHWGCFTPKQIVNVKKDLTEDTEDPDFSRLDGFDEMSEELQDKIRKAIEVGHVEDEEWRGDVQCNRPGSVGMRVKASKAKAKESKDAEKSSPGKKHGLTESENAEEEPAKKKQTRAKKAADDDEAIADAAVVENQPNMGKKRGRGRPRKNTSDDQVAAADVKVEPKKPGRPSKKTSDEDSPDAQTEAKVAFKKRGGRGKKVSEDEGADADTEMMTEPTEPKTRATRGKKITKDEAASADIEPKQPTKRATRGNKATGEAKVADKVSNEHDPAEDKPTKKASMTRATRAKKDATKNVSPIDKDVSSADNETGPASRETKKSTTRAKTANGAKTTNDAKTSGSGASKDEHVVKSTEKPKRTRGANNKTNGNNGTSENSRKSSVVKATHTPTEEDAESLDAIKQEPKTGARKSTTAKITIESAETTNEPVEATTEQSGKGTVAKSEDGPSENASAEVHDEPTVEAAEKPAEDAAEKPLEAPLKPVKAEYTDDDNF